MDRTDQYYMPAELEYRRQRAARSLRRSARRPRKRVAPRLRRLP